MIGIEITILTRICLKEIDYLIEKKQPFPVSLTHEEFRGLGM